MAISSCKLLTHIFPFKPTFYHKKVPEHLRARLGTKRYLKGFFVYNRRICTQMCTYGKLCPYIRYKNPYMRYGKLCK